MRGKLRFVLFALLILVVVSFALAGCQQEATPPDNGNGDSNGDLDYPTRPITCIVTYSAGGGTDVGIRVILKYLEPIINGSVAVVNVEGGGGEVGWVEIMNADNDGYTIGNFNSAAIMATVMRGTQYDPMDDFEFISLNVSDPRLFVVRADDDRFPDFEAFLQYVKDNPGEFTMATSGPNTTGHYAIEAFNYFAETEIEPIHFDGAGSSAAAFLGAHVDGIGQTVGEVTGMVADGTARVLCVMSEERLPQWPDVPTVKEYGIDVVMASNRGLCAPAGTPQEIIDLLADAVKQVMENPDFIKEMENLGLPLMYLGPDDYRAFNQQEFDLFELLVEIVSE